MPICARTPREFPAQQRTYDGGDPPNGPQQGTWVLNEPGLAVTDKAARAFIDEIQRQRQVGFGFVPFIGAGFSSPAGLPLTDEILPYLQRCICLALGAIPESRPRWNPRTHQWPAFDDPAVHHSSAQWRHVLAVHAERHPDKISHEAIGAASNWESALRFLSQIIPEPNGTVSQAGEENRVKAACIREIMKNKSPALSHRMLAALAGALRLDLIVTTNFDPLLETAFIQARNALTIFDLHENDPLPDWSAVSAFRSLLKLHGHLFSVRTGDPVRREPTREDNDCFLEYLLSPAGRRLRTTPTAEGLDFQSHVLVLGTVLEPRNRALIEHAWDRLDAAFRVYWVCYSEDDVDAVRKFTASHARSRQRLDDWCGSIVVRHTETGLLLMQWYQTIRRNLPPMLGLFPSVSRLTLPPLPRPTLTTLPPAMQAEADDIAARIRAFHAGNESDTCGANGLTVVSAEPDAGGVTTICSEVFRMVEKSYVCLWLDMNDIVSSANLFEVLLEAARFRLGQEHWTPTYVFDGGDGNRTTREPRAKTIERVQARHAEEFRRLTRTASKPWVVFLNARETPGINVAPDSTAPNGWLDNRETNDTRAATDDSDHVTAFLNLVEGLRKSGCAVVLLCRTEKSEPVLLTELRKWKQLFTDENYVRVKSVQEGDTLFRASSILARVLQWADTVEKQWFLHALLLMQRPRFLATIWNTDIMSRDREHLPAPDKLLEWLDALETCGLVRRKPGGFIWLHSVSREKLRHRLSLQATASERLDWPSAREAARLHEAIARWYAKVIDVSHAPAAVFEAVHHWCHSARPLSGESVARWNERACTCIHASVAVLKTNEFLIQTRGYSRGSCRKLEYIRDELVNSIRPPRTHGRRHSSQPPLDSKLAAAIRHLQRACTNVMRGIAREVGEDSKSYGRQQEYGRSLLAHPHRSKHGLAKEIHREIFARKRVAEDEWARWWRWCGMLAIASRSFHVANRTLARARAAALRNHRWLDRKALKRVGHSLDMRRVRALTQNEQIELLRIIELQAGLGLIELDAHTRALPDGNRRGLRSRDAVRSTNTIKELIKQGRDIAAIVRAGDGSPDSTATIKANWCESRLIAHESVRVSYLIQTSQQTKERMPQQAMGLLSEAESVLRLSDTRRYRSDLALVELHRGDARLREAEASPIGAISARADHARSDGLLAGSRTLVQQCREWQWRAGHTRPQLRDGAYARTEERQSLEPSLRRARALLNDSLRFLNRAEPVLLERRRNVWWTTWFFERKLRVIAWSVWSTVLDEGTAVPFLGTEAAVPSEATAADRLLEDGWRMIRADSYRLVTIVDAYASCMRGLQTRIMFAIDSRAESVLRARQERMLRTLKDAIERMDAVIELRKSARGPNDRLSRSVTTALKRMTKRIRETKDWIERE